MSVHDLLYRPVRAGTSIVNERINQPGTLGLIAKDAAGAAWMVSCYHVLCEVDLKAYVKDEAIFQPAAVVAGNQIAVTRKAKADAVLDCAAAQVQAGIKVSNEVLGIGAIPGVAAAVVGMRVIKSGGESGITEGIVSAVDGKAITIEIIDGYPDDYELSDRGDSGSAWLELGTHKAVGLHNSGNVGEATAAPMQSVLDSLGLKLI